MPMSPSKIREAENSLDSLKRDFLSSWGWEVTCQVPGSFWLWKRDFSDYDKKFDEWHRKNPERERHHFGTQCVPMDLAISMTIQCLYEPEEE